MKVFLHYKDNADETKHKTLKITLPKSWKSGPTQRLLDQFVESYNNRECLSDSSQLHLETDGDNEDTRLALASDAVVCECIKDRSDVFICHGPSKTLMEIETERKEKLAKIQKENENLVTCKHFGCNKRFPKGGPYPPCRYHAKPPVFHETAKFWSCCPHRKAYDWETFQAVEGCQQGHCVEVLEESENTKQFLGGCDLRDAHQKTELKSIDDFNRAQEEGNEFVVILDKLKHVLTRFDIDKELFEQVIEGMKKEGKNDEEMFKIMGKKLKGALKEIAVDQLRIK